MKYQKIFENALRKLNLSKKDVKDWKPAGDTYAPEIGEIKDAVVIWTKDGRQILFWEKVKMRFIEVAETDTIGDLISRLMPDGIIKTTTINPPFNYCVPQSVWDLPIPANVLYPEGSDYE